MEAWQIWLTVISIALFIGVFVWTFLTVFSVSAANDKAADMMNAMSSVVLVNLVLVMMFAGIAFWYTNTYPAIQHPYMMFILHFNILISILSLSISSLYSTK